MKIELGLGSKRLIAPSKFVNNTSINAVQNNNATFKSGREVLWQVISKKGIETASVFRGPIEEIIMLLTL